MVWRGERGGTTWPTHCPAFWRSSTMSRPAARPNSRNGSSTSTWRSGSPCRASCWGDATRRCRERTTITQSADVLKSAAYLDRLDHPTPMTRTIMSEIFKDMVRTVCHRTFRLGAMRGTAVVAMRFDQCPSETALEGAIERLIRDKAVACGEIWRAADPVEFPVSTEERLRGGDRKIAMCLLVETLRVPD